MIFTWDDIKQIVQRKQKTIVRLSILCAVCTAIYLFFSPLQYEAHATFKQSSSKTDQSIDLKNLIRTFSTGGSEGTSSTIMLSDAVLERTIEEIGLQAEMKRGSLFERLIKNLIKNKVSQEIELFRFSNLKYQGEKPLVLHLKKTDKTKYESPDISFTIHHLDEDATITIQPLQHTTAQLRKSLTIKPTREDKNLLLIKCVHKEKRRSAEIVNTLMAMYEKYLIEENKIIIGAQLSYLKERQEELSAKFDKDIENHAQVLKSNLLSQGHLGIKDEMDFVFEPLQTYQTRLHEIELELRQIDQRPALPKPPVIEQYSKVMADQIQAAKSLLSQIQRKEKIEAPCTLEELQPAANAFNAALASENTLKQNEIEGIVHDFMAHLSIREKSLQENSEWIQTTQNDVTGMNLISARAQLSQYSTQLDDLQALLKQVMFMRDHLFDPHFEISTLSNILNDTITQQMVQRSSELEAQLHDDIHRSLKDHERVKTTLAIHKRFLASHLDQTLQLGKIRIDLIKEKLSSLYAGMKTLLLEEKRVLEEQIGELKNSLQALPDLWVHENRLKFKSDLTKGMMEGLVNMAESKNLSHHLYQVESRPLDKAKIPLGFIKPRIIEKSTVVLFVSLFVFAFIALLQALITGFPVSLTTLKECGAHISGHLSTDDRNIDTLRRIAAFLVDSHAKGVVAIIGEQQVSFFPSLAQLLKKHQRTCCVVDCSFGKIASLDDKPGLFQILNGSDQPLTSFSTYDFLSVGASSQDSVELLKSDAFAGLIEKLSTQYDYVLLLSKTSIDSLESDAVLKRSTHAILVAESPIELYKPYFDLARQKAKPHVTFIQ